MSCLIEEKDGKVTVTLAFKRQELLYEMENIAHVEGDVMEPGHDHGRHQLQDVGQEGNVDRVTSVLNLEVARCREMLRPYTDSEIVRTELDDELKAPPVYGIVMSVERSFSQTTLYLLERLIHEYLVCKGLAEWMGITYPQKAQMWALKAEATMAEINAAKHIRRGAFVRKSSPF